MRNTDSLPTLDPSALDAVTGGCKKKCAMQMQMQMQAQASAPPPEPSGVDVTVATGAQAAQLIGGLR